MIREGMPVKCEISLASPAADLRLSSYRCAEMIPCNLRSNGTESSILTLVPSIVSRLETESWRV